jgi:hypothetical protein
MISASGGQESRPDGIPALTWNPIQRTRIQRAISRVAASIKSSGWVKGAASATLFVLLTMVSLRVAISLVSSQFYHTNILQIHEYSLLRHLDGTVYRPFAYRVLTDWLAQLVLTLHLPGHALPYIEAIVVKACSSQQARPEATCDQIEAYVMVSTGFVWGFLAATYLLALRFVGGHIWAAATAALAALFVNAVLLQEFGQPYDFTTLFFSTLMFYLAAQQRDTMFAVSLVVACLAKESFGLFVVVYVLVGWGERPLRQILRNLVLQSAIFCIVYEAERLRFAHNQGASMYHNFTGHSQFLFDNTTIFATSSLLVFAILLLYRLASKPVVLRRSMLILPLMLMLYVIGGQPGEFRIVFDVFPIILLPIADTLRQVISGSNHTEPMAYQLPQRIRASS